MSQSMINRGVDILSLSDLHHHLEQGLAHSELVLTLAFPILLWGIMKYDLYKEFPYNFYRWSIGLDWIYGVIIGVGRWLPGNPFYEDTAWPGSATGCRFGVFLDTFCQIGILYTNCIICACVFYSVFFKENIADSKERFQGIIVKFFYIFTVIISILTLFCPIHTFVGWCTADSILILSKQLIWFLAIVAQLVLLLPTNYMLWKSSKRDIMGFGSFVRYMCVICTQVITIFPIMMVEFFALTRKSVPSWIMMTIVVGFPLGHFIDFTIFSIKLWPNIFGHLDKQGHICAYIKKFNEDITSYSADDADDKGSFGDENYAIESGSDAEGSDANGSDGFDDDMNSEDGSEDGDDNASDTNSVDAGNIAAWRKYQKSRRNGSIFDRIPFWLHLSITILVPFILLSFVCAKQIFDYIEQVDASNEIRKDIKLCTKMSNFVHESQKERGATGVFLGSQGKKFQCEILSQYILTSFHKNALQYYLDFEFANVRLVTKSTFLHALIFMLGIDDHRALVQVRIMEKSPGIGYYTNMNMYFIGIVAEVCRDSLLGESIQHKMYANLAFFMAKEQAGIERAKGTGPLGEGKWFPQAAYRSFIEVISRQDTFIYFYEIYVGGSDLQFYTETMDDVSVTNAADMRAILIEANTTKLEIGSSKEWFNNMTMKINLVRTVERRLATDLTTDAKDIVDDSTIGMIEIVLVLASFLIINGLAVLGLARTTTAMKNFSAKKTRKTRGSNFCISFMYSLVGLDLAWLVLISVSLCGLGLIIVSWIVLKEEVYKSQSAAATLENMHLQRYLSNYIHETQKERGATGVYMSSSGKEFSENLKNQKDLTNVMLINLQLFNEEYVDFDALRKHLYWLMLAKFIMELDDNRKQSLNLAIPASQSLGFYTSHNGIIVNIFQEVAARASGGSIESRLLAYLGFMYMKEKAGNERAVGSVGFSSNGWGGLANYQKFISLVSIQTASRTFFDTFATQDQIDQFDATVSLKGSRVATEMREIGLSGNEGLMTNVDGGQWYGNITEKINAWRTVEVKIASDLEVFFLSLDDAANTFIIVIGIMLGCLFLICLLVIANGMKTLLNSRSNMLYNERAAPRKVLKDSSDKSKKNTVAV